MSCTWLLELYSVPGTCTIKAVMKSLWTPLEQICNVSVLIRGLSP